mgnify:CR=1 FL=1
MYKNIFDTHAHYEDEQFDCDRDELLSSFPENGISGVVTCGTDIITSEKSIALAEKYPFIYAAVGFHALNLDSLTADWCGDIKSLPRKKKWWQSVKSGSIITTKETAAKNSSRYSKNSLCLQMSCRCPL